MAPTDYSPLNHSTYRRGITIRALISANIASLLVGLVLGIALTSAIHPLTVSQLLTNALTHINHPSVSSPPTVPVDGGFVFDAQTGEAKCGTHWTEAKRLGCHFDVMASRWYSPDCFNPGVLEEMLTEVDFRWYADREHTQEVSRELVLAGEFEAVYPDNDYHIMHCLYLWRRLHSAILEHRYLDDDVYSYGHTLHCTRLIMQWPRGLNSTTIATSGIPFCRATPL
ncbi:hypothetical protein AbraIFM66951_011568 [Aspergillus brasiliensis]|uniref:Uncharacterized protein n=1 Tax=Aspergillus brasiliensis TaxID=319629 RepID=A0A9W6DNZ8_9EURO|nr:hypothetical protein AbraCBS73388_008548 [Aspergillus brasiliensis]GKZ47984.1 hypothetical protein AbraIFM66951_011568 [Aspergillus brasiliensis]